MRLQRAASALSAQSAAYCASSPGGLPPPTFKKRLGRGHRRHFLGGPGGRQPPQRRSARRSLMRA
eukprot:15469271-Alexandrium_andersonii.AAC.1